MPVALRRGAAALREDVEGYAELESLDCGKVLAEARGCLCIHEAGQLMLEARGSSGARMLRVLCSGLIDDAGRDRRAPA